jgi:hypothetical protein
MGTEEEKYLTGRNSEQRGDIIFSVSNDSIAAAY